MRYEQAEIRALRVVLAIALDRETAAACLDSDPDLAVALWPSSLYALLAAAMVYSPAVRCRCRHLLDDRLGAIAARFERLSPDEVVRHFVDGSDVLSTRELAALLWTLTRRGEPKLGLIIARLGAELEVAATRNGAADASSVAQLRLADAPRQLGRP